MTSERPTPAPSEGTPSKERREIPAFSRQDALQARLANPGDNYANINSANREVPALTAEVINPKATDSLIQQRSDEERRETAEGTVDSWKQTMVSHFSEQKTKRFFQESEKGKRFARAFQTAFDVDVNQFSADNATTLYDQFCTVGEGKNGAIAYADKIIESYKNKSLKELEDDLDAFKWMGNILGEKTSEILVQRISMLKRTENDEGKKELADTANANNRINKPNDQEITSLKFLYRDGKNLVVQPSTTPRETKPTPTPPTEPNPSQGSETRPPIVLPPETDTPLEARPVQDLLVTVTPNPDKNRVGEWFVDNPSNGIGALSETDVKSVIPDKQKPFYLRRVETIPGTNEDIIYAETNREVNPHVWDLQVEERHKERTPFAGRKPDERFVKATELTHDDSSTLALAAASSENPEKQAFLYKDIADILVQAIKSNPTILKQWIEAQQTDENYSLEHIVNDDRTWTTNRFPGDTRFRIIPLTNEGTFNVDVADGIWRQRIPQLEQAIKDNKYTEYHHRWIQALSHMVEMQKVINVIKSKQAPSTS